MPKVMFVSCNLKNLMVKNHQINTYFSTNAIVASCHVACSAGVLELAIVNSRPSWNSSPYWFGKSGWGGGGKKWKKTPARKGCENEKHPLISCASLIFRK